MKKIICIIFAMFCIINLSGCGTKQLEQTEPSKEELKAQEIQKLKDALLNDNYVEISDNSFVYKQVDTYKEDGTPLNMLHFYFDINSLTYSKISSFDALDTSVNIKYSFRTNTGSGTTVFFEEDSRKQEDIWNYTYDFNSGTGTCTSVLFGTCNDTSIVDLKNEILTFFSENNINYELLF